MDNAEHTLLLRDLQMSDAGTYSCTVANADGKVTTRSVELM